MTSTPKRCSSSATSLPSSPEPSNSTRVACGDSGVPSTGIGGSRGRARSVPAPAMPSCALMRLVLALLVAALLAACNRDGAQPRLAGVILDGTLDETSGLAASTLHRDTLWLLQ